MKQIITEHSVIEFKKQRYDMESFANLYTAEDKETAISVVQSLVDKGKAKVINSLSAEEATFQQVLKEEAWSEKADSHDMLEEANKDFRAQQKREGKATYAQVEFDFANLLVAQQFQSTIVKNLRIQESEIAIRPGIVVVVFKNITDAELNSINRLYATDKFVGSAISLVDTAGQKTTDAVHYAATKVIAPTAQVGVRAGVSIFKTLLTTSAKVTGGLISATSQGIKSAAQEIQNDPEVLRAGRDLIDVKDGISRQVMKIGNNSTGGGRIIK